MKSFWHFIDELMQKIGPHVPFYISNTILRSITKEEHSILDVGCGWGEPMKILQLNKHKFDSVGVDSFKPYLLDAKKDRTHDEYILCDVRKMPFKPNSFDTVLCMEVIEHLEKKDAMNVLEEMEKIARMSVIITTPVGFWPDIGRDENPSQVHKSGFYPVEFKKSGYRVRGSGINRLNLVSVPYPYLQKIIRRVLRVIFSPFSYYFPRLGENIICTKKMKGFYNKEFSRVHMDKIAFVHPAVMDYKFKLLGKLNKEYNIKFIFTTQGRGQDYAKEKHENIPPEWDYKIIRSEKLKVRGKSIIMYLKLIRELLRREYDIVLTSTSWYICFPIAKITGKKFILLTPYWHFAHISFLEKLLISLTSFIAKHADAIIVSGTKSYEAHLSFGAKDERIFSCLQPALDYTNLPTDDIRTEMGLKDTKIILFVGRIVRLKGLDYLIKSFAALEKKLDDVSLIIVGDGPYKKECEKLAEELNVGNIIFAGFKDEKKASYYKACDVFVLPTVFLGTEYEAWGLVLNEAMAFGKPIVTTDAVGAAYDLVKEGYNGYVVENKNVQELYDALYKILTNSELAKVMGENSRKMFEEKNDHAKFLKAFERAIDYVQRK